jgi:hypothetical protein
MLTFLIVAMMVGLVETGRGLNKIAINANEGMPVILGKVAFVVAHDANKVIITRAEKVKYSMLADQIFDWHYFLGDKSYGIASVGDFVALSGCLLLGTWLYYLAMTRNTTFPFLLRLFYFSSGYFFLYLVSSFLY